ncbi:ATP-binding protein [Paenibacillus polysaccharolyticus]|uniref:ATP-binding protein n=1 Tax=Paenibacillus polysaccharolyticus TaxID=582692 RepID=UPI0020408B18|nr:ATP-binding protein [Paenibacillus polysaccharolyticus]MCM3131271.1 ATP-binding protein [Paenibacillus polysaccharolyticus]
MDEKKIVIDPRIIQHLGKDLITSSDVAITELIKNSMDARSEKVSLHLFESLSEAFLAEQLLTDIPREMKEFIPAEFSNSSLLIIEDIGCGMSTFQLEEGFLRIGTDIKSNKGGGEIVLGEKGIGRLAAQRLGDALIVETSSSSEDFSSFTYINWTEIIKGINNVPYFQLPYVKRSYTRLWIFNVNLEDILNYPEQISFDQENNITLNSDLQAAINFLVSPFINDPKKTLINVNFNDLPINIDFPHEMLTLSESTHYFKINEDDSEIKLKYGLKLQPWYIERIHRAIVKAEGFAKLKKPHSFYKELLELNQQRIEQTLESTLEEEELCKIIIKFLSSMYPKSSNSKDLYQEVFEKKSKSIIENLLKIAPISGEIFSFKQNSAIGKDIIISSVKEQVGNSSELDIHKLKFFLENYNGIKLYRDIYRVGFLGNKESDWIKLQQYRTKGQQWFRFDLGNTVGYVSLNDPHQKQILEISSRLDISQSRVSESFKTIINIIFNELFYDLNQKANAIIKNILEENDLLGDSLVKRVKKNKNTVQQMIKRNKAMLNNIKSVTQVLQKQVILNDTSASMDKEAYETISKVIQQVNDHFQEDQKTHTEAAELLAEADRQLKIIEVESYNNYKLMANGLITETITHELHSLGTTNISEKIDKHFEALKTHFSETMQVKLYNNHVHPIKNNYNVVSKKIHQVGEMYSFLEKTFIKKGTYDEFVQQSIQEIVDQVHMNLLKTSNIELNCSSNDLVWTVPKGVLIHVFYNLFNNSKYWIDVRRKKAEKDSEYDSGKYDQIVVNAVSDDSIVVWDTGMGINNNMQDILFEPLQSGKPYNEGRGMGLYIVKKLMNSFGGDIILLPDLNKFRNRYKFLLTIEKSEEL